MHVFVLVVSVLQGLTNQTSKLSQWYKNKFIINILHILNNEILLYASAIAFSYFQVVSVGAEDLNCSLSVQ